MPLLLTHADRQRMQGAFLSGVGAPTTGFFENVGAFAAAFIQEERLVSNYANTSPRVNASLLAINRVQGEQGKPHVTFATELSQMALEQRIDMLKGLGPKIENARIQNPDDPDLSDIRRYEEIQSEIEKRGAELIERRDEIASRSGFLGKVGGFVGVMGGAMTDPPNILTLPFGAARAAGALKTAAFEFKLAVATETAIQPFVYRYKQELEHPYTMGEAIFNVTAAGVGAGLIAGGIKGLTRPPTRRTGAVPELVDRIAEDIDELPVDPGVRRTQRDEVLEVAGDDPQVRADHEAMESFDEVMQKNPFPTDGPQGERAHLTNVQTAIDAVSEGRIAGPDEFVSPTGLGRVKLPSGEEATLWARLVTADELELDAATYQYKAGGDDKGVTGLLRGQRIWDVTKADVLIVHELLDGRLVVADGHQRLSLARRAVAGGQKDVKLAIRVLREADGATVRDVRLVAAYANISRGSGTVLDAAKVLRDTGGSLPEIANLPAGAKMANDAQGLARLGDDVFNLVATGKLKVRYGAAVGYRIEALDEQMAAIRILRKVKPDGAQETQIVVNQIASEAVMREKQISLFGDEEIVGSLYGEKAKILSGALTRLKKNRAVFNTLINRAETIRALGNVLDEGSNVAALDDTGQALAALTKLANSEGPLNVRIAKLAQRLADGESRVDLIDDLEKFLDDNDVLGLKKRTGAQVEPDAADEGPDLFKPAERSAEAPAPDVEPDTPSVDASQQLQQEMDTILAENPDFQVAVDGLFDENGQPVMRSVKELLDDLETDEVELQNLINCFKGGK